MRHEREASGLGTSFAHVSRMTMAQPAMALAIAAVVAGGCFMPRDSQGTLKNIRGGRLRVGVIHHPPWANTRGEQISGVEVELVKSLARELDAQVQFIPGSAPELMEALEKFELDLVIGGLTRRNPWDDHVGLSRTYYRSDLIIGGPATELPVDDLSGQEVAVRPGDVVAKVLVRDEGGIPVEDHRPQRLAAAPAWQIDAWGLARSEIVLRTDEHVLTVPPGENGWLFYVDDFLRRKRGEIPTLLDAELKP